MKLIIISFFISTFSLNAFSDCNNSKTSQIDVANCFLDQVLPMNQIKKITFVPNVLITTPIVGDIGRSYPLWRDVIQNRSGNLSCSMTWKREPRDTPRRVRSQEIEIKKGAMDFKLKEAPQFIANHGSRDSKPLILFHLEEVEYNPISPANEIKVSCPIDWIDLVDDNKDLILEKMTQTLAPFFSAR